MQRTSNWFAVTAFVAQWGVAASGPSGIGVTAVAFASQAVGDETTASSPAGRAPRARLDAATIDEMLLDVRGRRERWTSAPGLVVITSVMQYQPGASETYVATADQMHAVDAENLVADLTVSLRLLTNNTLEQFASIQYETLPTGTSAAIVRPNQIIVGRFHGVRELAHTIGFGGRKARRDGSIIGATIVLDSEFDRTSDSRRLLRTHELGHALGFNHVSSRASIMNPRVGPRLNDVDRQIVELAFRRPRLSGQ